MPIEIEGTEYVSASELAEELGVSRQTIWRWRTDGKIPSGSRFRNSRVVFSPQEARAVREFANHVEPIEGADPRQMTLFQGTPETTR